MDTKQHVKTVLDQYLEAHKLKKTPERHAVLYAVYDFDTLFSIEDLDKHLAQTYFKVSKATLYSVLKIFVQARLVVRHTFPHGTFFEVESHAKNYCHQVCTVCGKTTEFVSPEINQALEQVRLKRFRKDGFSLYVYGVCSTCQSRMSRQLNSEKKRKEKDK